MTFRILAGAGERNLVGQQRGRQRQDLLRAFVKENDCGCARRQSRVCFGHPCDGTRDGGRGPPLRGQSGGLRITTAPITVGATRIPSSVVHCSGRAAAL